MTRKVLEVRSNATIVDTVTSSVEMDIIPVRWMGCYTRISIALESNFSRVDLGSEIT